MGEGTTLKWKKIVQTCDWPDPCNYLSNLLINTVRLVIFMLHRLSDTKAWMLAVLRWHAYSIGQMQISYRVQHSLNSIKKLLFDNFRVLNLYPKLLIFPLLLNFSIHSDRILSRCVQHIFLFLWQCFIDFSKPIIVWWVPGNNFKLLFLCLLNC